MKIGRMLKTLSWTTIGVCTAMCTSYFVFGSFFGSLKLVAIDTGVFLVLYYIHEGLWNVKGDLK